MKINTRARYALRMMADIYKNGNGAPVSLKEVAKRQNLSQRYLAQLAIPLKNAALLKSIWGNQGGYLLAKPGDEIRILDIIEAVDGPVSIMECVTDEELCPRNDYCECRVLWVDINEAINGIMAKYTLEDLIRGKRPGKDKS
ncbi:MAG: Rrf2 family transcriptional regulator [bacterium]